MFELLLHLFSDAGIAKISNSKTLVFAVGEFTFLPPLFSQQPTLWTPALP